MTRAFSSSRLPLLLTALGACLWVAVGWPAAFGAMVSASPVALFILAAAWGIGRPLAMWLLPVDSGCAWRRIATMGLGVGALSLLMLGLGAAGVMHRSIWLGLLALFVVGGATHAGRQRSKSVGVCERSPALADNGGSAVNWACLACLPFLAIALFAASYPPGSLWPAEGNGYDVLEYHLGAPRDWLDAGRIGYLPHNIYSNFPFNVEMLYLLAMVLNSDAVDAALAAQLLHFVLAALAVAAVWLAARPWGHRAAWIAATVMASCPFLAYLCGLAYVENGLLFFAALALAAILKSATGHADQRRWMLLAGLFAGLACGCKYTGVLAVLLPVVVSALWIGLRARPQNFAGPAILFVGAMLTFGPWLVRNIINTANPVFPLARSVFPEREGIWDDDGAERWRVGHLPAPEHRSITGRVQRLWHEIIAAPLFGMTWLLVVVGAIGLAIRRTDEKAGSALPAMASCWLMLVVPLLCWLAFTHLVGRFAVTLLVPASVIAAVGLARLAGSRRLIIAACMAAAVIGNAAALGRILLDARFFDMASLRSGSDADWFTQGIWPTHAHVPRINERTRAGQRVRIVADARRFYLDAGADYCVVFNRNPFAEAAARRSAAEMIVWLREQGYHGVYVDWLEMRRLRNSRYGFWESIDEELFVRLEAAGLRRVEDFTFETESGNRVYSTLYELAPLP